MDPISLLIIGLFLAGAGKLFDWGMSSEQRTEQEKHDINMANLQAQNEEKLQKTMFDYQNNFNTWSNNKSQMVEAGVNPALMYGSASPVSFDSSGSASGSASSLPTFQAFKSVDPTEFTSQQIAKQNADSMTSNAGTNSMLAGADISLKKAQENEAVARTAEHLRSSAERKNLEKIVYDTALANLDLTSSMGADFKSRTKERETMLPFRTAELDANTRRVEEEIKNQPIVRDQMRADIRRLNSVVTLNEELSTTEGYKRRELSARVDSIEESLKGSRLERIMSEFGLKQRHSGQSPKSTIQDFDERDKAAYRALVDSGMTPSEAAAAVLWYTGVDPKDLSPSYVNGASRVLSGAMNSATQLGKYALFRGAL